MKAINIKNFATLILPSLFLCLIISCTKESTDEMALPRSFRPGTIRVTAGQTQAKLEWAAALFTQKNATYTVEVSKDINFSTIDYKVNTDTTGVVITDENVAVKQKYFARVKAAAAGTVAESAYVISPEFTITGEKFLLAVRELEIKETSVIIRWSANNKITSVKLAPANGTAITTAISTSERTAGFKNISGLTANTAYTATLYAGTVEKGIETFTTPAATTYSVTLNAGADLAAAIAAAGNNDVIGLSPGTYNISSAATSIISKTITLKSTSGNPADTKVQFKEFTLKGTGAGFKASGIDFDGASGSAAYFLNLTGLTSDSQAADFTTIVVENCVIRNLSNCLIRANRASVNNHKIGLIKFTNCTGYDNSISSYDYFMLDKLAFQRLEVTKSTFYNLTRSFINCATTLSGVVPVILIDQCTINNFGDNNRYVLMDANANNVNFTMQNSIVANVPRGTDVQTAAIRASVATINFTNNNLFNFNVSASGSTAISLPSNAANISTINLGWDANTSNFTLPANSPLRTASVTGGPIGDPKWTY